MISSARLLPVGTLVTWPSDDAWIGIVVGYPFAHRGLDDVFVAWSRGTLGIKEPCELVVLVMP